MLLFSKFE